MTDRFFSYFRKSGMNAFQSLLVILCVTCILIGQTGCSFSKKTADTEDNKEKEQSIFEKERENQSSLAKFAASAGRENPNEKKKVSKGQTFLLSDKAREIYENTER